MLLQSIHFAMFCSSHDTPVHTVSPKQEQDNDELEYVIKTVVTNWEIRNTVNAKIKADQTKSDIVKNLLLFTVTNKTS